MCIARIQKLSEPRHRGPEASDQNSDECRPGKNELHMSLNVLHGKRRKAWNTMLEE